MASGSKATSGPGGTSFWRKIGKFLFVISLAVAMFLLGLSMVHYHFFRGGYINPHGVLKP